MIGASRAPAEGLPMPMKLSRFEKARIIGARALQVSMGAPIMVEIPQDLYDPIRIAELEYAADAIPITVRRAQEIDFKWDQ
jgi:DNA-directed RNA polymerase subunit K/omega